MHLPTGLQRHPSDNTRIDQGAARLLLHVRKITIVHGINAATAAIPNDKLPMFWQHTKRKHCTIILQDDTGITNGCRVNSDATRWLQSYGDQPDVTC